MTIPAGTHFGPYQITAPLGKGGMGEVYLAEDARLKRKVALTAFSIAQTTEPGAVLGTAS